MATSELMLSRPVGYRTQHSRADRLVEAGDTGTRQIITHVRDPPQHERTGLSVVY